MSETKIWLVKIKYQSSAEEARGDELKEMMVGVHCETIVQAGANSVGAVRDHYYIGDVDATVKVDEIILRGEVMTVGRYENVWRVR